MSLGHFGNKFDFPCNGTLRHIAPLPRPQKIKTCNTFINLRERFPHQFPYEFLNAATFNRYQYMYLYKFKSTVKYYAHINHYFTRKTIKFFYKK